MSENMYILSHSVRITRATDCYRASSVVGRKQFYIFNFVLKTKKQIATIFGLSISMVRGILIEKFMALIPLGRHRQSKICTSRAKFSKILFSTKCMVYPCSPLTTKILKFMITESGVHALGYGQNCHTMKMY